MKTILFQRRNALFSTSGFSVGVAVVIFAIMIFAVRVFFPGFFITLATPLLKAGAALAEFTSGARALVGDSVTLARERDALRLENGALQNENLTLAAQIDDLTALLGTGAEHQEGIVVAVLARPPESPYDTFVIAAGSISGVSVGMHVRGPGMVPVGEVESVTAVGARVLLYSAPGRSLVAWAGKERVPITLKGMGGGAFFASAPKASGVAEGDIVYLGEGAGRAIARVAKVEADISSPSATLFIASLANPFSIVWVTLVP